MKTPATIRTMRTICSVGAMLVLGACGSTQGPGYNSPSAAYPPAVSNTPAAYTQYGVVYSIEHLRQPASGIGVGTIAGAVVGGIIGNQVGRGDGNTAATVLGAAGGAYAGHELEKRNQQGADTYRITVNMQDGSRLALMQTDLASIRLGDRVRIDNGIATRY